MNENTTPTAERKYRPKLSLFHPNAKGTGGAVKFELHPAHDDVDGSIWVQLANQLTVGDPRGTTPVYPRFDWDGAVCVKLDFTDLTKMIQVFRGQIESLENGKGLCHRGARGIAHVHLRRMVEPRPGYMLEIYRTGIGDAGDVSGRIFLQEHEAIGLLLAIEGSMATICFGIPMIIPRPYALQKAS